MPTPAAALTQDAQLLTGLPFEGTIKAFYPFWDAQYRPYLLDAVRALPPEHYEWKPRPEMLTARQVILHIAEVEFYWVNHVIDGEKYRDFVGEHADPAQGWTTDYDAPDANSMLFVLEEAHRHTQRWFGLPPAKLAETRTRTRGDGSTRTSTVHWILDHVQEHEIHHRSQLNLYLRLLGLTPPSI